MILPTDDEIVALHHKYAPSQAVFNDVLLHSRIVANIAEWCRVNSGSQADADLVRVGCLLHDIGVYGIVRADGSFEHDQYIRHGVLGYEILKAEGLDETICRFASNHTGVGLTAKIIEERHLPLPPADYLAETVEERLIMYADKFHSKLPLHFDSLTACRHEIAGYGGDDLKHFEELVKEFGEPPVTELAHRYGQLLV